MKNKLRFKTASLVCFAVLIISFALAALPMLHGESTAVTEIPENSYAAESERSPDFVPEETRFACALYIDGKLAGYYSDVAAAKAELERQKQSVLENSGVAYVSAAFGNSFTFKSERFPVSYIEAASGLPFPQLDVELTCYETVGNTVEHTVQYRDNADLNPGKEKLISEGKDGYTETTYRIVLRNGVEVSRSAVAENIIAEPVAEVIERGVKAKKTAADITPVFIAPYDGAITSEYGTRYLMGNTFHKGVDISGVKSSSECYGAEIHAAGDGTVIHAGWMDGFGYLVILEHDNGMRTYYAHQKNVACKVGDSVMQGDVIGYIGTSGRSTGPHVHFEVRVPDENGKYYSIDPEPYIIDYDSYPHRG